MGELAAMIYAIACGIVVAGLVSSLHRAIAGDAASFRHPIGDLPASLWSVLLSVFAGPLIVFGFAVHWRSSGISGAVRAGLAGALALFWSFCSGVVTIQSLLLLTEVFSG